MLSHPSSGETWNHPLTRPSFHPAGSNNKMTFVSDKYSKAIWIAGVPKLEFNNENLARSVMVDWLMLTISILEIMLQN